MQLSRRSLLAGVASMAALAALPMRAHARGLFFGARWDEQARRGVAAAVDDRGAALFELALPARGHGLARRAGTAEALVLGRRPGDFVAVIDLSGRRVARLVPAATDRRFAGHGVFAPAGDLFYATELEFSTGDGVVGVYDARQGYRRLGEFRTGGRDPHDIGWLGDDLVVANGGSRPDAGAPGGGRSWNARTSGLARLDPATGGLRAAASLPGAHAHRALHHFAVRADHRVVVALQDDGASADRGPLAARWDGQGPLVLLDLAVPDLQRLRQDCGIAAAGAGGVVPGGGCGLDVVVGSGTAMRWDHHRLRL